MKQWTVGDVMTTDVVAVAGPTPFRELVEILNRSRVSAVPVIDADRTVLGVVSEADLLHKVEAPVGEPHRGILERKRRRAGEAKASAHLAEELMTSPAVVTSPTTPVASAAQVMDREAVKRLPVVDDDGHLVGIVARSDLLRIYLRDDEAIREEIIAAVLIRTMWIDPEAISVTVDGGVVTLEGMTDRRSTRDILVRLVPTVTGVIDLVDELCYEFDDTDEIRQGGYLMRPSARDVAPGAGDLE
jgi:CBS domain-containing protein